MLRLAKCLIERLKTIRFEVYVRERLNDVNERLYLT
jgi:hypothetical protein